MVELHITNSSNLAKASYDDQTKELIVEFKKGTKYKYFEVSQELWNEFAKTINEDGSAGKFFHSKIRNLRFEQVEE